MLTLIRRMRRDEAGFTLIELLLTVVILGIIVFPLGGALLAYFKNADATLARMSESHDAQMAASYFAQDVRATGVRDYGMTGTAYYPLKQSVETAVAAAGGLFPCGAAGTPDAVLRLAWDDFAAGASAVASQPRVSYVVQNSSELHRLTCDGSGALVSDVVVARNLAAPFAAVTCADQTGAAVSCTGAGAAVPSTVSLTLTIRDPASASAGPYTVTLTGQRRQS